jgi:anti-sigma regulatory factor (Ser/Thr protein kinase)/anti-anti-sigma regulatory factor
MSRRLVCTVEDDDRVVTVRIAGVLDLAATTEIRTVAHKTLAEHPTALVFDLAGLILDDEEFLSVFRAVATYAEVQYGVAVLLCSVTEEVTAALQVLALDRVLTICDTWRDAVRLAQRRDPGRRVIRNLPPRPDAAAEARMSTADACAQWGVPIQVAERLLVIVTELVGNAVRHAGTPIELSLHCSPHYIHVRVRDRSESLPAMRGPAYPDAESGRGLMIVDAFASAWGSKPTADGKVIWATIRRPSPDRC